MYLVKSSEHDVPCLFENEMDAERFIGLGGNDEVLSMEKVKVYKRGEAPVLVKCMQTTYMFRIKKVVAGERGFWDYQIADVNLDKVVKVFYKAGLFLCVISSMTVDGERSIAEVLKRNRSILVDGAWVDVPVEW